MKVIIRTDASAQIGGGHMMRCLALANALRVRGAEVTFVMARPSQDWLRPVVQAGFALQDMDPVPHVPEPDGPAHRRWLSLPWHEDARQTLAVVQKHAADWLIWDHYGLDARWVGVLRAGHAGLRVMAVDDLDDRPLGSDLVLDQTRLDRASRRFPALAALPGPTYATLRPEFAALRPSTLARRTEVTEIRRVLVTLGMADMAKLVPDIARALARRAGLEVDLVLGSAAVSLQQVRDICAQAPNLHLHVDTPDVARLIAEADLCIGAGGMTSWERCALGLGTLLVPVAENQIGVADALAQAGAVQLLPPQDVRDPLRLDRAIDAAIAQAPRLGQMAAPLCDGRGTERVCDALSGQFRPVTFDDAEVLFAWRNQPHIRAASLNTATLEWDAHVQWLTGLSGRRDGVWWVYREAGRDLGHVNARRDPDGLWRWGFYIGASDAPKGAGGRMLALALARLLARSDCLGLRAEVRVDNAVSIALHRRLGFRSVHDGATGDKLVFCLLGCDIAQDFALTFPKEPPP